MGSQQVREIYISSTGILALYQCYIDLLALIILLIPIVLPILMNSSVQDMVSTVCTYVEATILGKKYVVGFVSRRQYSKG